MLNPTTAPASALTRRQAAEGHSRHDRPECYEFNPGIGGHAHRLAELADAVTKNPRGALASSQRWIDSALESITTGGEVDSDLLLFMYSCSVLIDIAKVGGVVWVRDSRIFVRWPDWNGPDGRLAARRALRSASDMRPLTADELHRVTPLFAPDMDGAVVARILAEGRFDLASVDERHSSGIEYGEGFAAALRLWSMPYRGRQGRQK